MKIKAFLVKCKAISAIIIHGTYSVLERCPQTQLLSYVGACSALVLEVYYALIAKIKSIYRNLGVTQLIVINEQKLQFWMFRMFMLLSSSRLWLSQEPSHAKYGKDLCDITNTVRTYVCTCS